MDGGQEDPQRLRFTGAVLLQAVRLLPRHHEISEAEAWQKEGGDKIVRSPAVQQRRPLLYQRRLASVSGHNRALTEVTHGILGVCS